MNDDACFGYDEEYFLESRLFPWLDDPSLAELDSHEEPEEYEDYDEEFDDEP